MKWYFWFVPGPPADRPRSLWTAFIAVPIAAAALMRPIGNPDLFWHLSAGRWILKNLAIPRADFLSWLREGAAWVDFEWGSQAIYSAVHSAAGFGGLWALKLLVLGTTLALVAEALLQQGQDAPGASLGVMLAGLGILPSADIRPENFSLLLFALQLLLLERERRFADAGASRLFAAAAIYAVWANLHAGFVFGLALIGAYAVGDLTKFRRYAPLGLAAAAGTLLNPYGPKVYAVLLRHAASASHLSTYLIEWRPVTPANAWTWPFWALLLGAAPAGWRARLRGRTVPKAHLLALFGLALACWQTRNTPYYCIAASVYVLRMAGRVRVSWLLTAAATAALFVGTQVWPRLRMPPWKIEGQPERTASFLVEHRKVLGNRKFIHPYGWGGYLGWKTRYKVFWDGRYLFQDLLPEEARAKENPGRWQAFLKKYKAEVVLLEHAKLRFAKSSEKGISRPFYVYFMPQRDWALVHWDPDSLLFVRRGAAPKDWLSRWEFVAMRPGDEAWVRQELGAGRLKPEALRHDTERVFRGADIAPKRP